MISEGSFRIVDSFAGCGRLCEGFRQVGFKIIADSVFARYVRNLLEDAECD